MKELLTRIGIDCVEFMELRHKRKFHLTPVNGINETPVN